jgi:transposase, IS5 family
MIPRKKEENQGRLFFSLSDTLNQKHPLYILSHEIKWEVFETAFNPLYCADNGRLAKTIRLMVGFINTKIHT